MTKMKAEHKAKINKAIDICEKRFDDFTQALNGHYSHKEADEIKNFILDNTVFAGGIFRSVFTDTPINDIDVFFTSKDAAIEFQHRFRKFSIRPFFAETQITALETFNWDRSDGNPKLAFITQWANRPSDLLNSFDFTFNQHFFSMKDYEMCFDCDTFQKRGAYIHTSSKSKDALRYYTRAIRFMQEGFDIESASWMLLARGMTGRTVNDVYHAMQFSGSGDATKLKAVHLTGKKYRTDDYFSVKKNYTSALGAAVPVVETMTNNIWDIPVMADYMGNTPRVAPDLAGMVGRLDELAPREEPVALDIDDEF